jgi:hypothetical protein
MNDDLEVKQEGDSPIPSKIWAELVGKSIEPANAITLTWWRGGLIVANMSLTGTPELVIQVTGMPLTGDFRKPSSIQVAGLEIWFENVAFNGQKVPSLLLRPKLSENLEVFYSLADHLVSVIAKDSELEPSAESLESVIDKWVKFWSKQRPDVSREMLLGLLGELIALDEVLDLEGATHSIWEGPKGSPQDFRGTLDSLEVKVQGTHAGPIIHKINGLLQLQIPEQGKLFVLSLRVKLGANGAYAFDDLVDRVSGLALFSSPDAKTFFGKALESAGYTRNLPVDFTRYDVIEKGVYEVVEGFPRLTKENITLDPRVMDVTYSVDFSGAGEFLLPESDQKLKLN